MKKNNPTFRSTLAFVTLTLFSTGCEIFSRSPSPSSSEQSIAVVGAQERLRTEPRFQEKIDQLIKNMVYVWNDRVSCSGLRLTLPETVPEVQAILLSGHCVSGNPVGRSGQIKSPKFALRPLATHGHKRIDDFLADYFFTNQNLDYSEFEAEVIQEPSGESQSEYLSPSTFLNDAQMLAIYHPDFSKHAWLPLGGVVHRDYFSLLRQAVVENSRGVNIIMLQNNLALIPLIPDPPYSEATRALRPIAVRPKPKPQPGDRYFALYLGRDNVNRELQTRMVDIDIIGFSPKHGLLQGCEAPPKEPKDYVTDRSAVLYIERNEEFYAIGLGSFGSPTEIQINGKRCALTTFTHIAHHNGWMKLAFQQATDELQNKK